MKDARQEAISVMGILYHSAFGGSWQPYIKTKAKEICDKIISVLDEISLTESGTTEIDLGQSFYKEVKIEIDKL